MEKIHFEKERANNVISKSQQPHSELQIPPYSLKQILVALMVLANSRGLRWDWDSGREKEKTSPIEETAQTVVPPEVTFVIMLGAYI